MRADGDLGGRVERLDQTRRSGFIGLGEDLRGDRLTGASRFVGLKDFVDRGLMQPFDKLGRSQ